MRVVDFGETLTALPTPTPEQYALARRHVERVAPDLVAMLFEEV